MLKDKHLIRRLSVTIRADRACTLFETLLFVTYALSQI